MSFESFDQFQHSDETFVESAVTELLRAGMSPKPEAIKRYQAQGGLAVHLEEVPKNLGHLARFTRRNDDWIVTFERRDSTWLPCLDETPPFKKFSNRSDVNNFGYTACGWTRGYRMLTQDALNEFVRMLRNEDVYLIDQPSNKPEEHQQG